MIRLFVLIGVVATVSIASLVLFGTAPEFQMAPKISLLPGYQNGTLIPAPNSLLENEEIEHGIFEVPAEDERELEKAELMPAMDMPGMNMGGDTAMNADDSSISGMNMNADGSAMAEGEASMSGMNMNADGSAMAEGDASMSGMKMNADGSAMAEGDAGMSGMNMNADGSAMAEGEASMSGMNMNADGTAMAEGDAGMSGMSMNADETAMSGGDSSMSGMAMASEGGLRITDDGAFDRQIELAMEEWRFSDMNIELKRGERIRFTITNAGKIPHEFMFMEMAAMAAVKYRSERADWNLLEHEALYEKSLVLPDGSFSFVVQVQRDGVWMFMCMLPYHMQMGMMGQMATPGLAMKM